MPSSSYCQVVRLDNDQELLHVSSPGQASSLKLLLLNNLYSTKFVLPIGKPLATVVFSSHEVPRSNIVP